MTWSVKYKLKEIEDIVGQDLIVEKLKDYIKNFSVHKGKAILLYGPTGSGKTSIVHALANHFNNELFEINSSDIRNKEKIEELVGAAATQMSLFGTKKIILLDEVDNLSGTKDRGGAIAIAKIIPKSVFPIIMTANDAYASKLKEVRKKSLVLELEEINYNIIKNIFKKILEKEKIEYEETAISQLARSSSGDIRSAINDLESIAIMHKKITQKTIYSIFERERKKSIENALMKVFKTTDINISLNSFNNIDENLDETILWLEYNLPKEYEKIGDLYRAYESLSKSDLFNSRIRRRQNWRYLVYVNFYQTVVISLSKKEKYKKVNEYKRTTRLLKMWQANISNAKRKAFSSRMKTYFHVSSKKFNFEYTPYFKYLYNKDEIFCQRSNEFYEINEDEIKFLKK